MDLWVDRKTGAAHRRLRPARRYCSRWHALLAVHAVRAPVRRYQQRCRRHLATVLGSRHRNHRLGGAGARHRRAGKPLRHLGGCCRPAAVPVDLPRRRLALEHAADDRRARRGGGASPPRYERTVPLPSSGQRRLRESTFSSLGRSAFLPRSRSTIGGTDQEVQRFSAALQELQSLLDMSGGRGGTSDKTWPSSQGGHHLLKQIFAGSTQSSSSPSSRDETPSSDSTESRINRPAG